MILDEKRTADFEPLEVARMKARRQIQGLEVHRYEAELLESAKARVPPGVKPRQVAFLHIMKTAGTTVHHYLRGSMPGVPVFTGDGKRYDRVSSERLALYGLVLGHFSWQHVSKMRDPFLITFLRDPVERVLSFYSHLANLPPRLNDTIDVVTIRGMTIGEFVRSENPIVAQYVENHQSWALALDWRSPRPAMSAAALARAASDNLKRMDFVGAAEQTDADIRRLAKRFALPAPETVPRRNLTANRITRDQVTNADLEVLRERNEADFLLYQEALGMRRRGPGLRATLLRLFPALA